MLPSSDATLLQLIASQPRPPRRVHDSPGLSSCAFGTRVLAIPCWPMVRQKTTIRAPDWCSAQIQRSEKDLQIHSTFVLMKGAREFSVLSLLWGWPKPCI